MKAKDVKKILCITQPTLSKYVKIGKISVIKINDYNYIYNDDDVYKLIGLKKVKEKKINISYSRVSTQNQKNQLLEQTNRIYNSCISKNIHLDKQYEEIKSGMSPDRKIFNEIIQRIIKGEIELLIIENKDRLIRFGFETLEQIFKYFGTKIIVLNDIIDNKSYEQELTEDLISTIHYFTMKSYSHRRKLNKIRKELEQSLSVSSTITKKH